MSSLFLSSADRSKKAVQVPAPSQPMLKSRLLFSMFCCLPPSPALESFFACNLLLEIAKRDLSVTLIDFGCERSVVRLLMGTSATGSDAFPCGHVPYPDYRVESLKFENFSEVTLVIPSASTEQDLIDRSARRIFAREDVQKSNATLITWPVGPQPVAIPEILTHFEKAIFLMDDQADSLVKAYSWVKRVSPICREFLICTVFQEEEGSERALQNVSILQQTVFKHLHTGLKLRVFAMPLNREAWDSIRSQKPLALASQNASPSAVAIANLCDGLLRNG